MNQEYNLQDLVRCHLCEIPEPSLHCDICNKHLCKNCEGKHLVDKSQTHNLVLFKERRIRPRHTSKQRGLHYEQCDNPQSVQRVFSGDYEQPTQVAIDVLVDLESNEDVLRTTEQELEKTIFHKKEETEPIFIQQTEDLLDEHPEIPRKRHSITIKMLIPLSIVLSILILSVVMLVVVLLITDSG